MQCRYIFAHFLGKLYLRQRSERVAHVCQSPTCQLEQPPLEQPVRTFQFISWHFVFQNLALVADFVNSYQSELGQHSRVVKCTKSSLCVPGFATIPFISLVVEQGSLKGDQICVCILQLTTKHPGSGLHNHCQIRETRKQKQNNI